MKKCVVVIPIYTLGLSGDERMSLARCGRVLASHPIVVIHPMGLDVWPLRELLPGMKAEAFAPQYFVSIEGYNRLMLSTDLYDRFSCYEYMLVYQTDAWVFADRLDEWCAKGYDYIGAPWIPRHRHAGAIQALRKLYARCTGHSTGVLRRWHVGNGGFSLRRPALFSELLRSYADKVPRRFDHIRYNEDVFWSTTMCSHVRTPGWIEAMDFAIEKEPGWALERLGHMPFGCHGWNKPPFDTFWRALICPDK